MLKHLLIPILIALATNPSLGQTFLQGGASFSIGTPVNRVGAFFQLEREVGQAHIGIRSSAYYYFNGLGTAKKRWEAVLGAGIEFAWGDDYLPNDFHILTHRRRNANIGYWYIVHLENRSKQTTGELSFNLGNFELITQNDALAWKGKDKFRTGTLLLAWYQERHKLGLNIQLWTGNPHVPEAIKNDPPEGSTMRWGYIDLSNTTYGKISHGVLALDYSLDMGYAQTGHLRIGIDDERIRNAIQNKLFHDWLLAFTRFSGVKNRHIPMIDQHGDPFLKLEGQKIKPTKFFMELGANLPNFY